MKKINIIVICGIISFTASLIIGNTNILTGNIKNFVEGFFIGFSATVLLYGIYLSRKSSSNNEKDKKEEA